jgi:hypothetical protein
LGSLLLLQPLSLDSSLFSFSGLASPLLLGSATALIALALSPLAAALGLLGHGR